MKKDILLVVLALISISLLVMVVGVLENAKKTNKSLDEERYNRMVAEESLQKSAGKLATLENQLKGVNDKMGKIQDLVEQEKNINQDLQKQYDELNKAKADLESKLKTTLEEKVQPQVPAAGATEPNAAVPVAK